MTTLTIRYFAALREALGRDTESLGMAGEATAASILAQLAERHPAQQALFSAARIAIDDRFAMAGECVPHGSEVAIIPPVSGG